MSFKSVKCETCRVRMNLSSQHYIHNTTVNNHVDCVRVRARVHACVYVTAGWLCLCVISHVWLVEQQPLGGVPSRVTGQHQVADLIGTARSLLILTD